jgi:RNA polymerase primary sigma factor
MGAATSVRSNAGQLNSRGLAAPKGPPSWATEAFRTTALSNGFGAHAPHSETGLAEKVKDLLRLAREQGFLTNNDIREALAEQDRRPDQLSEVFARLRSLDVEIVEETETEQAKRPEPETSEEAAPETEQLDILDDPVRLYMKQMARVPLLTREQEVAICKRIEKAEDDRRSVLYGLGFTAKEHIALAEKLIAEPPKERFDRVVLSKMSSDRKGHLGRLRQLIKKVRALDQKADEKFAEWREATSQRRREKACAELAKLNSKLLAAFPEFCYEPRFWMT